MVRSKKESTERFVFFRYCSECGKKYSPVGKWSRLCDKCREKAQSKWKNDRIKNGFTKSIISRNKNKKLLIKLKENKILSKI